MRRWLHDNAWALIVALFMAGVTYGTVNYRVSAAEESNKASKAEARAVDARVKKTEEAIAALVAVQAAQQATSQAQQQSLDRIDRNLEDIAKELRNR